MINVLDHIINIDLANTLNSNKTIDIKMNDTLSHNFIVNIFSNSIAYNLTGSTARIYMSKPDSTVVYADCNLDNALTGNISYVLDQQCTSCVGTVPTEITIYGTASEILTSISFSYNVLAVVRNDGAIISSSEFTSLTTALGSINSAIASIGTIETINAQLQATIVSGNTANSTLTADTTTANSADTKLLADTATANSSDTKLLADTTTANLADLALKADTATANSSAVVTEITNARQGYANLLTNLQSIEATISASKYPIYINVMTYGAKGDGVTDDTAAIQSAITANANSQCIVIFFPSTGNNSYKVTSTINIPSTMSNVKLLGGGIVHSLISSSATKLFSLQTNGVCFDQLYIYSTVGIGSGGTYTGTVMFSDDRYLNSTPDYTDNLDITVRECYLSNVENVLNGWGHGIIFDDNCFYNIRCYIGNLGFPTSATFVSNGTNNDNIDTGFRGFIFRRNRIHFSPCVIINNVGTNAGNLTGVLISNNQLEGSCAYINGYMRHGLIQGNIHFQTGAVSTAMFQTFQCDNVVMDLNISGTTVSEDLVQMYNNGIINATGACNDLTIRGNVRDIYSDVFYFNSGGRNINIDIIADNISLAGTSHYLVNLNAGTFDGLVVKGSVTSPNSSFIAVRRNGNNVVNYDISGLMLTGTYVVGATYPAVQYHSLNEQNAGVRRLSNGSYTGNGGSATSIYIGYKPLSVTICGYNATSFAFVLNATANSANSAAAQTSATGITFTATGFTYAGIANNSNIIYSWSAN